MTMAEATVRVEVTEAARALLKPVGRHETRIADLELAVLQMADVLEHMVAGNCKLWRGDEAKVMYAAIDNARALATPEGDDDPEPEPPAALAGVPRYFVDLKGGEGYATDDLNELRGANVLNLRDRKRGAWLVWQGRVRDATLDDLLVTLAPTAEAA